MNLVYIDIHGIITIIEAVWLTEWHGIAHPEDLEDYAMEPGYLELFQTGELHRRIDKAQALMKCCTICPQNCRVDRIAGPLGVCGVGQYAPISSYGPHFGEERPLVGA